MRVRLYDVSGDSYEIRSENAETILKWLQEYFPQMIESSTKYHYPWRIEMWPEYGPGIEPLRYISITPEGLREIGSWALNAAIVMGSKKS